MPMLTSFHRFSRSAASVGRSALMASTSSRARSRSPRARPSSHSSASAGVGRARGLGVSVTASMLTGGYASRSGSLLGWR